MRNLTKFSTDLKTLFWSFSAVSTSDDKSRLLYSEEQLGFLVLNLFLWFLENMESFSFISLKIWNDFYSINF